MSIRPSLEKAWRGLLLVLPLLVPVHLLLTGLGTLPLIDPDEGRNAAIGWAMQRDGSWLVPSYDGLPYLDKPAWFFKAVGLAMGWLGPSELAARLPSALSALFLLLVVFGFCRRYHDRRTAVLAVGVVGSLPLFVALGRYVIFDMMLALPVCVAILAGFAATTTGPVPARRWQLLSMAAVGIATLIKGPVGALVPWLVLLVFYRIDGQRGAVRRLFGGWNLPVFVAIVLPWFVGLSLERPDFPYYGLVRESLLRFTTNEFHRAQPFWFYLPVIGLALGAWALVLPEAALAAWRARTRLGRADRLMIAWAVVVLLFFSVSQSKLPGYVLTAAIALGILVARLFALALAAPDGTAARIVHRAGIASLGLAALVSCAGLAVLASAGLTTWLGTVLAMPELSVVRAAAGLVASALLSIAIGVPGVTGRRPGLIYGAILSLPVLLPVLVLPASVDAVASRSASELAAAIRRQAGQNEVACFACLPPGLPFYLKRDVTVISTRAGAEIQSNYVPYTLAGAASWPARIVPAAGLDAWLGSRTEPWFLLTRARDVPALRELMGEPSARFAPVGVGDYQGILVTPMGIR